MIDCSICNEPIIPEPISGWTQGNNAWPVNDGRCCDNCNNIVIQVRLNTLLTTKTKEINNGKS